MCSDVLLSQSLGKEWRVGRALHVVGRRLQGVLRRRRAVENVARLAEAVRGGGGAGAGLAAGMGGVAPEPWPM